MTPVEYLHEVETNKFAIEFTQATGMYPAPWVVGDRAYAWWLRMLGTTLQPEAT